MIIAIDFDGTCVTHEYPEVGRDIGAAPVLKELIANGHKLMLWTMRSHGDQNIDCLNDAINWFKNNDIELWEINKNPEQYWSNSNKQYAQLYIDDAALGCPLIYPEKERPYVDWVRVKEQLKQNGILR